MEEENQIIFWLNEITVSTKAIETILKLAPSLLKNTKLCIERLKGTSALLHNACIKLGDSQSWIK